MYTNKSYQPVITVIKPRPPKVARSGLKEGDRCDCCKCRKGKK